MYDISFRCYFSGGNVCNHYQTLSLADVPKWIDCYKFTHPSCLSVSIKIWFHTEDL